MAIVQLIDGRMIEGVKLTNVRNVGEEGSRTAIAHIDGQTYEVYNSIIDGFNPIWYEQMSMETFHLLKGTGKSGYVEGSLASSEQCAAQDCASGATFECVVCNLRFCLSHIVDVNEHGEYGADDLGEIVPIFYCVGCAPWNEQGGLDVLK